LALDSIELEIAKGEFFSLLGPSGCGKTTLLRLIAGLDSPDAGRIILAGYDLAAQSADKRPINTVFQTYALFPHLTVFANVAFGLRMRGVGKAEINERANRAMKLVEIEPLGSRKPHQLSGGQKQRVALARALVNEPRILLLDEPMAAIDLRLRKQLQTELRALQQRLGITFIYVTHDQEEALLLSDRVAVMNTGRIEQIGSPREIYERPQTEFVARFMGSCNILRGRVFRADGKCFFEFGAGRLEVGAGHSAGLLDQQEVLIAIRAEQILLTSETALPNSFSGRVVRIDYQGANTHILVKIGSESILVALKGGEDAKLESGSDIQVHFPASALRILTS